MFGKLSAKESTGNSAMRSRSENFAKSKSFMLCLIYCNMKNMARDDNQPPPLSIFTVFIIIVLTINPNRPDPPPVNFFSCGL